MGATGFTGVDTGAGPSFEARAASALLRMAHVTSLPPFAFGRSPQEISWPPTSRHTSAASGLLRMAHTSSLPPFAFFRSPQESSLPVRPRLQTSAPLAASTLLRMLTQRSLPLPLAFGR